MIRVGDRMIAWGSTVKRILFLDDLRGAGDFALVVFRVAVGAFLIWGVWDNIESAERMAEFAAFLRHHGFPHPELMAPLSVWAQFACGAAFIAGFLARWAGVICAVNFIVAIVMVDAAGGIRAAFPAAMLVLFGLYMATYGAGRFSLDRAFARA
jgi:putative oxidoreductase